MIKKLLCALALMITCSAASAAGGGFTLDKAPDRVNDLASLQNGAKLFVNYCLNCHSASAMRYNKLKDIGLTDEQIKESLLFTGDKVGDLMLGSISTKDGKAWFGVPPPDLSVIARAKAQSASVTGADYIYNVQRLLKKLDTAKTLVPQPVVREAAESSRFGVIYFGSTSPAMHEALEALQALGLHLDAMRLRAYPFPESVRDFILAHDQVFVVEQNRDAQLRGMLVNELEIAPSRLPKILHYDGTPITARFITAAIAEQMRARSRS